MQVGHSAETYMAQKGMASGHHEYSRCCHGAGAMVQHPSHNSLRMLREWEIQFCFVDQRVFECVKFGAHRQSLAGARDNREIAECRGGFNSAPQGRHRTSGAGCLDAVMALVSSALGKADVNLDVA